MQLVVVVLQAILQTYTILEPVAKGVVASAAMVLVLRMAWQ